MKMNVREIARKFIVSRMTLLQDLLSRQDALDVIAQAGNYNVFLLQMLSNAGRIAKVELEGKGDGAELEVLVCGD